MGFIDLTIHGSQTLRPFDSKYSYRSAIRHPILFSEGRVWPTHSSLQPIALERDGPL